MHAMVAYNTWSVVTQVQCASRLAPRLLQPSAAVWGGRGRGREASTEAPPPVTTFTEEEELMRQSGEL